MNTETLPMLSARDWELLREHITRLPVRREQVILAEGGHRRGLFIVGSGAVRVEQSQDGEGIALALLGPGEIFGEMGFVENAPASASVIAQEDGELEVIADEALQSIKEAEPGFSIRFYHSLAISLARRLRLTTARLSRAGNLEAAQVNPFRLARTGNISARQIPPTLSARLDQFERSMLTIKQQLRAGALADDAAAEMVAANCDDVVAMLDEYTTSDPLVEIGWSDLLSFRDTGQLEAGIGDYVFRETFRTLILSGTMARCYAKPRGFPDDFETIQAIYAAQPEGDDRLGPLIDRWFLNRPICRSRRAARDMVTDMLADLVARHPAEPNVRIASLASGVGAELLSLCSSPPGRTVRASFVDLDGAALRATGRRAEKLGLSDRVTLVQGNVTGTAREGVALLPENIVYALGLCDYLTDEQVTALLNRMFDLVVDGGSVIVSNLGPDNPDRSLMEHILDWKTYHRSADGLKRLFAASQFAGRPVEIMTDPTGVILLARCGKGD